MRIVFPTFKAPCSHQMFYNALKKRITIIVISVLQSMKLRLKLNDLPGVIYKSGLRTLALLASSASQKTVSVQQ